MRKSCPYLDFQLQVAEVIWPWPRPQSSGRGTVTVVRFPWRSGFKSWARLHLPHVYPPSSPPFTLTTMSINKGQKSPKNILKKKKRLFCNFHNIDILLDSQYFFTLHILHTFLFSSFDPISHQLYVKQLLLMQCIGLHHTLVCFCHGCANRIPAPC